MMFKVLKVYLRNSLDLHGQEIYCMRLELNEGLDILKNKVLMRSPQIKSHDAQVYWFDLENDKIIIACDDDLKFFMEESACNKIIFDFHPTEQESSRKRTLSQMSNEISESSKKIRKQIQLIDLSSETSSMDTDDDDFSGDLSSFDGSKNSLVSNVAQFSEKENFTAPHGSAAAAQQSPNVTIISVDVIKSVEEPETVEILDENRNSQECPQEEVSSVQKSSQQMKTRGINRIVISEDSSSDEDTEKDGDRNTRRHSDRPVASSYSFTNVNGDAFESRASYDGGRYHQSQSFRRHHGPGNFQTNNTNFRPRNFRDQARYFQRAHAQNMETFQENARLARENAERAVRASTAIIPDLVSTFQAHFRRPIFRVADINQHLFGSFQRR